MNDAALPITCDPVQMLVEIANYSFAPIHWQFKSLTGAEKIVIGDQANFDALRAYCTKFVKA
jgi:hypothetical protein